MTIVPMELKPSVEPTPEETHRLPPVEVKPPEEPTLEKTDKKDVTNDDLVLKLFKYLLLLALLVATVTYAVGFNPPGGVWQDTAGHLAGEPIIRDTHYRRYLIFFYSNAAAFGSSLVVIVLMLLLDFLHKTDYARLIYIPLRLVLLLGLLSLMVAYAAGTCRDMFTIICSAVLVTIFLAFLVVQIYRASKKEKKSEQSGNPPDDAQDKESTKRDLEQGVSPPDVAQDNKKERRLRKHKVLMVLATFAVSITYVAGLNTPGGFWDSTASGHRPGDSILKDRHKNRLRMFFVGNTTAFAASLQIIVVLLNRKLALDFNKAYPVIVALAGLVVAYVAGSCRETDTTVYLAILVAGCAAFQMALFILHHRSKKKLTLVVASAIQSVVFVGRLRRGNDVARRTKKSTGDRSVRSAVDKEEEEQKRVTMLAGERLTKKDAGTVRDMVDKARSLVLLLATLAATITYQAGLNPPGGLWQDNGHGHKAGDPILLTTHARRYKTFFYCNSIAFVTSLVAIVVVQLKVLLKHHVLEVAMVLDLFGLIGAYAAGSCREISTSIYVLGLAGAVLVYVVIHVVLLTLGEDAGTGTSLEDVKVVEKTRKRLLVFAILAATVTYQAGLTPPGGFRLQDDESGHHAGDPVLLNNFPPRYHTFFYSNSVSFMLSIALIILLVNPHVYRPAIRTHALSVCTVAGLCALVGAYAAGSTQHLKTSIKVILLVVLVLCFVVALLIGYLLKKDSNNTGTEEPEPKSQKTEKTEDKRNRHAKRKYLMLLAVLVASVTYQAGLTPPGGTWQSNGGPGQHEAGDPVMHDNRRARYLAFFYSNSASFAASILVIILLVPKPMQNNKEWLGALNTMIMLDLLGLLGAYAAGTGRGWKTSVYVLALVFAVLLYLAVHVMVSIFIDWRRKHQNVTEASRHGTDTQAQREGHGTRENSEQLANGSRAAP